jgi:hypothetical protein
VVLQVLVGEMLRTSFPPFGFLFGFKSLS